nr:MAG TPA: hypothetical protein [Caudoviricetes sp.]
MSSLCSECIFENIFKYTLYTWTYAMYIHT